MTSILVVDPNEAFATLLVEELLRQGYEVLSAYDSSQTIQIARTNSLDLALLDMGLEDPGTLAVARQLREILPGLRLMLIPMMGEDLAPDVTESIRVQGVLPKPFFLPELPERIEQALRAPLTHQAAPLPQPAPSQPAAAPEPPAPVAPPPPQPPAAKTPAATVPIAGVTMRAVGRRQSEIQRLMNRLLQELAADAVLLTVGNDLAAWVGRLEQKEAEAIAQAVVQGWLTSVEVGRILGREQARFEESLTGGDYMLYALGVDAGATLAVVIRGTSALGLLRHRARGAADEIAVIAG